MVPIKRQLGLFEWSAKNELGVAGGGDGGGGGGGDGGGGNCGSVYGGKGGLYFLKAVFAANQT